MAFGLIAMGIGLGLQVLGGMNQAKATEQAAAFNAAAAVEDVKMLRIEGIHKLGVMREQGAKTVGSIVATGAKSGVNVNSGSMLTAITKQASINAENEFLLGLEVQFATTRIKNQAALGASSAANQAAGFRLGAAGTALSGAGQIASLRAA